MLFSFLRGERRHLFFYRVGVGVNQEEVVYFCALEFFDGIRYYKNIEFNPQSEVDSKGGKCLS